MKCEEKITRKPEEKNKERGRTERKSKRKAREEEKKRLTVRVKILTFNSLKRSNTSVAKSLCFL